MTKINWGWYVVYLLMCFANAFMSVKHGYTIDSWQFWAWSGIIALVFVSGSNYRKED